MFGVLINCIVKSSANVMFSSSKIFFSQGGQFIPPRDGVSFLKQGFSKSAVPMTNYHVRRNANEPRDTLDKMRFAN